MLCRGPDVARELQVDRGVVLITVACVWVKRYKNFNFKTCVHISFRVFTCNLKLLSFLKTALWNVSVLCPQFSLIQFGSGAA
jgi:hypothetical protein